MTTVSISKPLFWTLALVILLCLIFFSVTYKQKNLDVIYQPSTNAETGISISQPLQNQTPKTISTNSKLMGDDKSRAEIRSWFLSRGTAGFSGKDAIFDYMSLDRATLEKMLNEGNVNVLFSLIFNDNFFVKGDEAIQYIEKAIVMGSSDALLSASIHFETLAGGLGGKLTREERTQYIVDSLAYLRVAELRGDFWPSIQSKHRLTRQFKSFLTEDVKSQINPRADELYSKFEQQRINLGLGPFDNSVPQSVIDFYARMIDPEDTQMMQDMKNHFSLK